MNAFQTDEHRMRLASVYALINDELAKIKAERMATVFKIRDERKISKSEAMQIYETTDEGKRCRILEMRNDSVTQVINALAARQRRLANER